MGGYHRGGTPPPTPTGGEVITIYGGEVITIYETPNKTHWGVRGLHPLCYEFHIG
jgi:hypothetical protein